MNETLPLARRPESWKWWVCILLLLATMVNYMDRQTISQTALRIRAEFKLDEQGYARVESVFALCFAAGSIVMGWLVDRWTAYWLYPIAVLAWSAAGFITGLARTYEELLICRGLLGFAEAGNWPCALKTTQKILAPAQRSTGNGILQSGAAFGAIFTPPTVLALVSLHDSWRPPFLVVGAAGVFWVFAWLGFVRQHDLVEASDESDVHDTVDHRPPATGSVIQVFLSRSFLVLVVLVVAINSCWHIFRAWLPQFLQEQHGYSESSTGWFTSAYYVATDGGSLTAGFVTLFLIQQGMSVHRGRLLVFFGCSCLTALSLLAANLERGPLLLATLLVIGFGALGLFPNYYSFTQELTVRHQGKVTGVLSCLNWVAMAGIQELAGWISKETGSFSTSMGAVGLLPLGGLLFMFILWQEPADGAKSRHTP